VPSHEREIDGIHDRSCAACSTPLAALQDFDSLYVGFGSMVGIDAARSKAFYSRIAPES
jgi:hypothetical protein